MDGAAVGQGHNNLNNGAQQKNEVALIDRDPLGMAVIPSVMNVGVPEMGPHTYRACLCCSLGAGIQTISFWYVMVAVAGYIMAIVSIVSASWLLWAFLTLIIYATLHCIPGVRGFKFVQLKSEEDYYYAGERLYSYYLILCTLNLAMAAIGIGAMITLHYYNAHEYLRYYFFFFVLPFGIHGGFSVYNIFILKQYFREKAFQKWQRESLNRNMYFNNDANPNNVQLEHV